MVDRKRLKRNFLNLTKIGSPSGKEGTALEFVKKELRTLAINFGQDKVENIIARTTGEGKPILVCTHLDTVEPCFGVKPVLKNGVFKSGGKTILGADNKAVVAAILEFLKILKEDNLKTCPLEIIFTVQEEFGSKGASALDFSKLRAKRGIVFDRPGPFGTITSAAPFYYTIDIEIKGKSVHAGLDPQKGVNAITIAASAISKLKQGRINKNTIVNIGKITGGESRNVVPGKVFIQAEVRSLNNQRARSEMKKVVEEFRKTSEDDGGKTSFKILNPAQGFRVKKEDEFVKKVKHEIKTLGFTPKFSPTCSGSDANILNNRGIKTLNLTYGARETHTTRESIALKDLENIVKLLLRIFAIQKERTD
ncbi:peptidase M20 [candidate division WWE3 bacterium CG09_land_8_20_14_0_10_47_33]|uniref:Peptidase M20 n=1 Tax=candidate division WWE3 bacterium CG_4_9_14_0_2_um_filter_48_10 TaxID=1975078 RepID=A0A2M8EJQ4_UNCKA|nr:MAG: peptidase M20 [candidate division WWE3 bacterium CG09_land_8_20_14_0_10_47_33]PIZ41001.1 MAG: peptidase M20 [candidate division WWE3 bacterium CG_4_10_14_0_2_um_filter_47_8]PJC22938.1 MAG: peptidase M20 [candidate division WWE3 bacterium CG_4_9_14_0_2_um_filter_48_10]PJE52156.1 MAG: peptidase M20 [candidate division WWE3 bacterium CG10_big_fil_rev_8_21_14_0_10_48_23]